MKTLEKQLQQKIKTFQNQDVTIYIGNLLKAKLEMNNIYIDYDDKTGNLCIKDNKTDNQIIINIASAHVIKLKCSNMFIKLDNSVECKIIKE